MSVEEIIDELCILLNEGKLPYITEICPGERQKIEIGVLKDHAEDLKKFLTCVYGSLETFVITESNYGTMIEDQ